MIRTLFNEVFKAAESHINIEGMPLARGDESASASTGRIIPGSTPRKRG